MKKGVYDGLKLLGTSYKDNMNIIKKTIKHTMLVTKHRWYVFKLAFKAGIPLRGLTHDLSKFSPTEFIESVKYYNGKRSPINACIEEKGYSLAWLNHKGKNRHHLEYWESCANGKREGAFLPYKYMVEMICDKISAGITYNPKTWTTSQPLEYWINVEKQKPTVVHPATIEYIETVFKNLEKEGIEKTINSQYLKKVYRNISIKYNIRIYG